MPRAFFEIPYYHDYISPALAEKLLAEGRALTPDLVEVGRGGGLETPEALRFLTSLYDEVKSDLARVLGQRARDRKFIDERVAACHAFNKEMGRDWLDPDYKTVIGLADAEGRIVIGPKTPDYAKKSGTPVAPLPDYLKGPHVTLFGPPDSAKMAINAMNAYHRKLANEPKIVAELLGGAAPMWGADDEDSKTPLRADLVDAAVNLTKCFDGTLSLQEGAKTYALAEDHLSLPIKRFPGLALPATFLFYKRNPIPLHLYDFALHLFHNWKNERALVFYVPKLENEEEAAYLHSVIAKAEAKIRELHPEYKPGTVRLMIVLENPRAILRAHEIMDALHPYFAGASLGWHDYLASTARLFKNDPNYRIPVKADPDIVIKYIKASHLLLADVVGPRGGIKVGGMYGILPLQGNAKSLQVTLKGFIRDVVTQMKRNLTGFWVAHPDFVRLGLALVEAWKRYEKGDRATLDTLVKELLDPEYHAEILNFIHGPDIEGLDVDDPNYVRSLIVADIKESDYIPNNHPDEIRYNVFQSLQYLTDWLSGSGCVALPTVINGIPVRVMDDLATAERSRWEVWHELRHGRFPVEDFLRIAHEEMNFIRRDLSDEKKIVQVKWDERTAKWYPIAFRLMLQLMTAKEPPEFATELLMPFTVDSIRNSPDPWAAVKEADPGKFALDAYVERYHHYFDICGFDGFARAMARNPIEDLNYAKTLVLHASRDEVRAAAAFHGDIGQSKASLDARARAEQEKVSGDTSELVALGARYKAKFGVKFLTSAKGKTAEEMLRELRARLENEADQEWENARLALWEISRKRLEESADPTLTRLDAIRKKCGIAGTAIAVNEGGYSQAICLGEAVKGQEPVRPDTQFQIASLSKTLSSAFALEFFRAHRIPLTSSVNALLAKAGSPVRLDSDLVTLEQLLNHTALNLHYVNGFEGKLPPLEELIQGKHGYEPVQVLGTPGERFHYSGGGFLVLEYLLETLAPQKGAWRLNELTRFYLDCMELRDLHLHSEPHHLAVGYKKGVAVPPLRFPPFAAGAYGSARDMARFLDQLTRSFHETKDSVSLLHDTAVTMLHGMDRGSRLFMGADMGLGVFVAEAGPNAFALHQGANDGFRALFLQCFRGPDQGKGLVIFCNGDNEAVPAIAEMAREILTALRVQGIDFARTAHSFDANGIPQEQIVNLGYKALLLDAFLPTLPEEIEAKGPRDPRADFNLLGGARILHCTNQKFARAENLFSPHLPTFDPALFGAQGKIMDSWETARHNPREADALTLELARPGSVRYVSLSTEYHDGNQAEFVRIEGYTGKEWIEILPKTRMEGHALLELDLGAPTPVLSQARIESFPDGGLSRVGLYTEVPDPARFKKEARPVRFSHPIPKPKKPLAIPYAPSEGEIERNWRCAPRADYASLAFGARLVEASNEHYGPAAQVLSPFPPLHMFDGLETARSRKSGHHEELTIALAKPTRIASLEVDFTYFVNNNPREMSVSARFGQEWFEIVPRTPVKAFAANKKVFPVTDAREFSEIRVMVYPDGGVHRVKVFAPE